MASNLADILRQEYKTKGLIGGAVSAMGKSSREKTDIRNILFGGSGLGSVVGRKVFGRGYSATDRSGKTSEMSSAIGSGSSSILQEISINGKITAKNSMALPAMASQMNIMQKNIAKLVKLQGETPSTKAQSYFSNSKFRENAYEATFNKNKGTTPSAVGKEKESGLGGILGLVTSLFVGLASKLGSFGSIVAGLVGTFMALGSLLYGAVKLVTGLIGLLPGGKLLLKGLKLGALAAGGFMAANALAGDNSKNSQPGNTNGERTLLDRAGQGLGAAGGAALAYGGLKVGSALGQKAPQFEMRQSTIAEKGGSFRKASDIGTNKTLGEKLERMRKFAVKITSKKQNTLFRKLLGERLGKMIAFKVVTLFASFAAAPFTAGASLLITLASAALLTYDIYQIYDAIFGKDGIEKALDAVDESKKEGTEDSNQEPMSFEDALVNAFAEALGLNQPTPTSPTSATPSLPKAGTSAAISAVSSLGGQQQTYSSLGGGEFGPDMIAATGVGADRVDNTSPTSVNPGNVSEDLVNYIKRKEGFTAIAKGDYGQYSIGYGTKANSPTEGPIDEAEADRRLRESLSKAQKAVIDHAAKHGYNWDQKKIDALSSFTYNLGPGALNQLTANGTRKDDEIGKKILEYNTAGGKVLPGLTTRRAEESSAFSAGASLIGSASNTGNKVSEASSAAAAANRMPSPSSGGNSTTNIIGGGGSGNQSSASMSAANPYDVELAKILTTRMSIV